ncbi:MAG: hypothetical protein J1F38_06705 [Muribaculaceae bacterium]|nr:hypothetical protein [Muribaculaceae bacterium]
MRKRLLLRFKKTIFVKELKLSEVMDGVREGLLCTTPSVQSNHSHYVR